MDNVTLIRVISGLIAITIPVVVLILIFRAQRQKVHTQGTMTVQKPIDQSIKRSSWGATLLTICVVLNIFIGWVYAAHNGYSGSEVVSAIGQCSLPVTIWLISFVRHYFTEKP